VEEQKKIGGKFDHVFFMHLSASQLPFSLVKHAN
jgi:hypothetical protein